LFALFLAVASYHAVASEDLELNDALNEDGDRFAKKYLISFGIKFFMSGFACLIAGLLFPFFATPVLKFLLKGRWTSCMEGKSAYVDKRKIFAVVALLVLTAVGISTGFLLSSIVENMAKVDGQVMNTMIDRIIQQVFINMNQLQEHWGGYRMKMWVTNPTTAKLEISNIEGWVKAGGANAVQIGLVDGVGTTIEGLDKQGKIYFLLTPYDASAVAGVIMSSFTAILTGMVYLTVDLVATGKWDERTYEFRAVFHLPFKMSALPPVSEWFDAFQEDNGESIQKAILAGMNVYKGDGRTLMDMDTLSLSGEVVDTMTNLFTCLACGMFAAGVFFNFACCTCRCEGLKGEGEGGRVSFASRLAAHRAEKQMNAAYALDSKGPGDYAQQDTVLFPGGSPVGQGAAQGSPGGPHPGSPHPPVGYPQPSPCALSGGYGMAPQPQGGICYGAYAPPAPSMVGRMKRDTE
jgi:hypothetical protein